MNLKWVKRILRREGLKVPQKKSRKVASGSTTDCVSVCGRSATIMSAPNDFVDTRWKVVPNAQPDLS